MTKQDQENLLAAGLITGEAFAEEYMKLANMHVLRKYVEANGFDKVAAGFARRALQAITSRGARRVAGGAALTAAGLGGGVSFGKKREQEKMKAIAPQIYRHGFVTGARQGFERGSMDGARRGFAAGFRRGYFRGKGQPQVANK